VCVKKKGCRESPNKIEHASDTASFSHDVFQTNEKLRGAKIAHPEEM